MSNKFIGHGGYQVKFTDALNQTVVGGVFWTFDHALSYAHNVLNSGRKNAFKITRLSDKIVLAQSK